jgi:hypothetical protein
MHYFSSSFDKEIYIFRTDLLSIISNRYFSCSWFGGVAAATPPNHPQRRILTHYFNNYNFSKLK